MKSSIKIDVKLKDNLEELKHDMRVNTYSDAIKVLLATYRALDVPPVSVRSVLNEGTK